MNQTECGNCGAILTGPYCSACGQHAREPARTVAGLAQDAWQSITSVDGRSWRTFVALLFRPGKLTREYFADRRARYLPPIRVYLILSVIFFAVISFSADREGRSTRTAPERRPDAASNPGVSTLDANHGAPGFVFDVDTVDCDRIVSSFEWLEHSLQHACQRNAGLGGTPIRSAFIPNVAKMMFVFLPVLALVMRLMYWRPPHLYVEHAVFFLHVHAALFLILLLALGLSWMTASSPTLEVAHAVLRLGGGLIAAWYVFRAMQVYYAQSAWMTFSKFVALAFAYTMFLVVTLVATLVLSALTA